MADMRVVVARALSALDMFSDNDGKLSPTASGSIRTPFGGAPGGGSADPAAAAPGAALGSTVVPRKATIREGVFTGLNSLMTSRSTSPQRQSSSGGAMTPHVEHKIETLVAAPAAVEEALASLIVDHQDRALQYRALLTYVKRVYHPFLLREPQVNTHGSIMTAAWIYDDPRLANTAQARHQVGAFLVLPCMSEIATGLSYVQQAMAALGTESRGGVLHISVCGEWRAGAGGRGLLAGLEVLLCYRVHDHDWLGSPVALSCP